MSSIFNSIGLALAAVMLASLTVYAAEPRTCLVVSVSDGDKSGDKETGSCGLNEARNFRAGEAMRRRLVALLAAMVIWPAQQALGWGATGHEWATGIAIEKLPEDIPAFVRDPAARPDLALMGRELDRSKGAGETHDKERDPGHYIDLSDDGKAMAIVALDRLPVTREAYDTQLRSGGSTQYKAGYLPYSIVDGWQQIRKDFAYWRADVKGAETAATPEERAWFEADRRLREKLTLRDIGIWSHYVADASQPMHVSVHFNGWGDFPNPEGYTDSKKLHAYFEGEFVKKNLRREAVAALVPAAATSPLPGTDLTTLVQDKTQALLRLSLSNLVPLYEIEKQGGFRAGDQRGIDFATARLAVRAQFIRDMIVDAWLASATGMVGYPMVNVRDIEGGKVRATRELMGAD